MNDMEWGGGHSPEGPFMAEAPPAENSAVPVSGAPADLPDDLTPDEAIGIVARNLARAARELDRYGAEMEHDVRTAIDPEKLKEALKAAKTARESLQQVMLERNKVDTVRKDIAGGVGGGSLDLDAARDEIGRRLACLRRAEGS